MRAITTRYIGPSNFKGSRIVADDGDMRIYVSYDHDAKDPHLDVALALCRKRGWTGKLHSGGTRTGNVYVWDNGDDAVTL